MKQLLGALLAMGSLTFAIEALAQSSTSTLSTTAVQTNPAPAAPVTPSKRYACRATADKSPRWGAEPADFRAYTCRRKVLQISTPGDPVLTTA